jgi:hypothetical protein
MATVFPLIGSNLAWIVGFGSHIRLGFDAIMGCNNVVFLPMDLIQRLQDLVNFSLNQVYDPLSTYFWQQG